MQTRDGQRRDRYGKNRGKTGCKIMMRRNQARELRQKRDR
jgi:hypothetical protein